MTNLRLWWTPCSVIYPFSPSAPVPLLTLRAIWSAGPRDAWHSDITLQTHTQCHTRHRATYWTPMTSQVLLSTKKKKICFPNDCLLSSGCAPPAAVKQTTAESLQDAVCFVLCSHYQKHLLRNGLQIYHTVICHSVCINFSTEDTVCRVHCIHYTQNTSYKPVRKLYHTDMWFR